ncbi:MAG: peptidase M14, partial [Capnocytophaga sp.]|nr:peptidase M14 [Capnocytophaga sp.]
MKLFNILFLIIFFYSCDTPLFTPKEGYITPFEIADGKKGASYEETINYYRQLADDYSSIALKTMGKTDSGIPLYLAIFNKDGVFDFSRIQKDKMIILISNGMYASENEGVDASMLLMRNLAQKQIQIPENVVIATIPILNYLDFMQNDSIFKNTFNTLINRDLENDFIKNESKNSISFSDIFHSVQPDFFIDTRSLKGFKEGNRIFYQTVVPEKLSKIKFYLQDSFFSQLSDSLKNKSVKIENDSIELNHLELLPYPTLPNIENANTSIGYASLWNSISLKIATQNEKNYQNRVENMYNTLKMIILLADTDFQLIKTLKNQQDKEDLQLKEYSFSFLPDSLSINKIELLNTNKDSIYNKDSITNTKKIIFFNKYLSKNKINIPKGYI